MIYEHSAVDPVSKIQVTEVNQLYDIWANLPENSDLSKDIFIEFLKTPEAEIFILQHQSLIVEPDDCVAVLISKFV